MNNDRAMMPIKRDFMNEQPIARRKRILLVEDQPEVRETIRMLLQLDEHFITEAENGTRALELFAPGRFDLVISDFKMPRMRGDELARRLKALAPSQPILMVTGSIEETDESRFQVDGLLKKPFMMADLRQAIGQLTGSAPAEVSLV